MGYILVLRHIYLNSEAVEVNEIFCDSRWYLKFKSREYSLRLS